jgi:hypothetical protein
VGTRGSCDRDHGRSQRSPNFVGEADPADELDADAGIIDSAQKLRIANQPESSRSKCPATVPAFGFSPPKVSANPAKFAEAVRCRGISGTTRSFFASMEGEPPEFRRKLAAQPLLGTPGC